MATQEDHHTTEVDGSVSAEPEMPETQQETTPPKSEGPRRSGRQSVRPSKFGSPDPDYQVSSNPQQPSLAEPRRNPKRKVSQQSNNNVDLPSNLLEEALRPLDTKDIEEWEGWAELESDPAFFNIILRDLGVQNAKAQELFTIGQESIDFLPKPVFGLIFLFEYLPGLDETEDEEESNDVWFANQATHNACATVALLNIVMNAPNIRLGDTLKEFKESTMGLSTPLRGHRLSSNAHIRSVHNSFTRRMDHLNADLALENEASEASKKKTKARKAPKGKNNRARGRLQEPEYAFHFIAYVPAGGYVWELDGLKTNPHRLGPINSDDWTTIARPQIEARMLQYEDTQLSFNLLALCQDPLAMHSKAISSSLASLQHLRNTLHAQATVHALDAVDGSFPDIEQCPNLSEFQLCQSDIEQAEVPQALKQKIERTDLSIEEAQELYQNLVIESKSAMGEYRAELISMAEDEQRVKGRKKDYGPALHKWVTKLAEKGVLEDLLTS